METLGSFLRLTLRMRVLFKWLLPNIKACDIHGVVIVWTSFLRLALVISWIGFIENRDGMLVLNFWCSKYSKHIFFSYIYYYSGRYMISELIFWKIWKSINILNFIRGHIQFSRMSFNRFVIGMRYDLTSTNQNKVLGCHHNAHPTISIYCCCSGHRRYHRELNRVTAPMQSYTCFQKEKEIN